MASLVGGGSPAAGAPTRRASGTAKACLFPGCGTLHRFDGDLCALHRSTAPATESERASWLPSPSVSPATLLSSAHGGSGDSGQEEAAHLLSPAAPQGLMDIASIKVTGTRTLVEPGPLGKR
jgi:hypothetical protein